MESLTHTEIRGNWATLLLPIQADQSIDWACLEVEVDRLIEFGVDGIYSNGSAGEFYNQTEAEYDRVSEILAARCEKAAMPFQIGASHASPIVALERVRRAATLRPSAIQVILPDWFIPSMDEAVAFLNGLAEVAAPVGLVLYNPPHAKWVLTPEQIGAMKRQVPGLVGVKVCDGDAGWYADVRQYCKDLSVFIPGHHLATGMRQGAHGAYSNVACLHPQVAQRWYVQTQESPEAAMELETRICRFMNEHIVPYLKEGYSNMSVDKFMAAAVAWCPIAPRLRWPYCGIDEGAIGGLRQALAATLPEFLDHLPNFNRKHRTE